MATTYDLALVQGERFSLGFRYRVDGVDQSLVGWVWRGQARQSEAYDADLIVDLTTFITLNGDGVTLDLELPSETTFGFGPITRKAAWDLFIWPASDPTAKVLLIQGAVSLDKSTTDLT